MGMVTGENKVVILTVEAAIGQVCYLGLRRGDRPRDRSGS